MPSSTAPTRLARLAWAVCVAVMLGGCSGVGVKVNGKPVVNRESIRISDGVARLVMQSEEPVVLEEDARIRCSQTLVTGSHIPFTYCQTREEYEDAVRRSQNVLRNEQGTGTR